MASVNTIDSQHHVRLDFAIDFLKSNFIVAIVAGIVAGIISGFFVNYMLERKRKRNQFEEEQQIISRTIGSILILMDHLVFCVSMIDQQAYQDEELIHMQCLSLKGEIALLAENLLPRKQFTPEKCAIKDGSQNIKTRPSGLVFSSLHANLEKCRQMAKSDWREIEIENVRRSLNIDRNSLIKFGYKG